MRKVLRSEKAQDECGEQRRDSLDVRIDPSGKQSLILITVLWSEVVEEVRIALHEMGERSNT
jgi:hypothetical protein